MLMLAVSTSGAVVSAALIRDGVCVRALEAPSDKRHAETTLPLIEQLLTEAETALSDVELFAVDVGPGSFTGVRIGVSVVNAMGAALHKKIVPVDALRALYRAQRETPLPMCILLDAGNGNGYAAQFLSGEALTPPEAVVTEPYLGALPAETVIVAEGKTAERGTLVPAAAFVGLAAEKLRDTAVEAALPLYLRPSQAERMWRQRQEAARDGH